MKNFIPIIGFLGIASLSTFGQCVADAGESIHRCHPDYIVQLGGSETATGGIEPYTFEWTIDPIPTGSQSIPYIYASNMLNDTATANPDFIYSGSFLQDSMIFFLKVTDSNGCQSFDSVAVTTSIFGIHLYSWSYNIDLGDSVFLNQIPNICCGNGTSTYNWNPTNGLSDSTLASGFWAKPESSISYTATVKDSKGCVRTAQEPTYHIYVNSVGINENDLLENSINFHPNPMDDILQISIDGNNISKIIIYSNDGVKLLQHIGDTNILNVAKLSSGVYVIEFHLNSGEVIRKKILKR